MKKVVLFIAMSLDGRIADKDGRVDWLTGQEDGEESPGSPDAYSVFIQSADTVIMGWNTYHQIVTELSPDEWVYAGLTSYVITHRSLLSTEEIRFTDRDPVRLVEELRGGEGKKIWICGGANIIQPLVEADLIDEYHISVIPTLLGSGLRLFGAAPEEIPLRLISVRTHQGMAELVYTRRAPVRLFLPQMPTAAAEYA